MPSKPESKPESKPQVRGQEPYHSVLMGNPRNPSDHKGDYADIIKECYKSYLNTLFSELVDSIGSDSDDPTPESVQEFRRKMNNSRRMMEIALRITQE